MVNPVRHRYFPTQFSELFVSAATGDDTADGSLSSPFKTITRALQQVTAGMTTIRLSPGTYSAESGEQFPLMIPDRVSVAGGAGQAQSVVIRGGGPYDSPTFGQQSIALRLGDTTLLNELTVTNPLSKGTGIWIESVATIANCRILNCGREGIFATDRASLAIVDCLLQDNRASGISLVRHAKGQIRRTIHQGNSFGLVISDYAAPLVVDSQFLENRTGIVLSGNACPVLRNNRIEKNQRDGLAVFNYAAPDLGHPHDPAYNLFQDNQVCDLRNATSIALTSVGNDLLLVKIEGAITFGASQIKTHTDTAISTETHPETHLEISPETSPETMSEIPLERQKRNRIQTSNLKAVLTPPPEPRRLISNSPISDLTGHWAEILVHCLLAQWVINPFIHRLFEPDRPISRAESTTWLIKTFNLPMQQAPQTFADVPADYWAAIAISQAQRLGFVNAFPDQTFRPEAALTRLQAIVSLVRGLGLQDGNPEILQIYRDRAQVPSWAVGAIARATQSRLIVSQTTVDRLRPMERITRAELAAMLYQGLVSLSQAEFIVSPHIVNPAAVASFSDIQDHWAAEFIRGLASQGIMGGLATGTFEPDRLMTRAEYAELLAKGLSPAPERPAKTFVDVPEATSEANKADERIAVVKRSIDQVYRSRLMGGFADDTFRPDQPVTRLQVLLALVGGLKCPSADLALLDRFTDADAIPDSARRAIAAATAQWLVVNYPSPIQLQPNQFATRAEVAAMVYQALVRLGKANPFPSPYIINPRLSQVSKRAASPLTQS